MTSPPGSQASGGASKQVDLAQMSLARLLFALLRQRFTGTIEVDQRQPEPGTRTVYLRGGMPVYTDWVSPPDVLGEVLLARGLITQDVFHQALSAMARDGGLLGQVLLSQGALDFTQLSDALKLQCTRKLLKVFELRQGPATVTVVEHGLGNGDELSNQVNSLGLIRLGVQRTYDEARVQAEMGDALGGPLAAADALSRYQGRFGFHAEDRHLLDALNRGGTVGDIAVSGVNRRRLLQITYTLWSCQMLLVGDAARQAIAARKSTVPSTRSAAPPPPPAAKTPPKPSPSAPPPEAEASSTPAAGPTPASTPPPPKSPPKSPSGADAGRDAAPSEPATPRKRANSTKPAPPPADPADGEFGERLHAFETKIAEGAHAFALFGLELDAGRKEVRKVWAELSKAFHPDSLESRGLSHLHDRVEDVFAAISEANSTLQNKDAREQLRAAVEMGGTGDVAEDPNVLVRNALEGEMIAREGDKLLRASNFQRALEQYERSLELSGNEPDVLSSVSWCRYQVAGRTDVAGKVEIENLAKVIEDAPMASKPHYYTGLIKSALGDLAGARESLKKALELDRRNTDAERHLRAVTIKMKAARKAAAEPEKKSIGDSLRGLFSKK